MRLDELADDVFYLGAIRHSGFPVSGAAIGDEVGLYYDSPVHRVQLGDFLQTPSGRLYRVQAVRIQQRGEHIGRQHLRAIVWDPKSICPDDVVYPLHWYPRKRRARKLPAISMNALWLIAFVLGIYYATNFVWVPN